MTFEIKLANGKSGVFGDSTDLADFYQRMRTRQSKKGKKKNKKKAGAAKLVKKEGEALPAAFVMPDSE